MKIAVWILSEYKPQAGGGFSLYDKLIQLIDDHIFSDQIEVCFVGHRSASDLKFKKEYVRINVLPFEIPFVSKTISKVSHKSEFIGKMEGDILRKNNIDLIYYPVQGLKHVNNFPFVTANWDIGHLSSYAFPEIALNNKFEYREKWYANEIYKALMVFAESKSGREELLYYTKLNPERVGIVPLFPGDVVSLNVSEEDQKKYLEQYNLQTQKFFFYPAQFWAHKNHYNLLLAFKKFTAEFPEMKLVLPGSDKGNKDYIEESAKKLSIENKVIFAGFISNECLYTFYKNAKSLVFSGFLGPTNMPLLEARMLDCPVTCSDLKGHREIMQDGAYYFDPLDPNSIYDCMKKQMDIQLRSELLTKAKRTLQNDQFSTKMVLQSLNENFLKLKSIRQSWGKNDQIF